MQRLLMVAVVPLLVLAMVLSGCTAPPPPAAAGSGRGGGSGRFGGGAAAAPAAPAAAAGFGEILKEVQARGKVKCGMNPANPGFSMVDADGNYSGLDIDLCRAIATAIFNDPNAVEFVPDDGRDALHAAAERRHRRAGAVDDAHLYARHGPGAQLCADLLLRRPGAHGAQGLGHHQARGPERGDHLHGPWRHDRAEYRRCDGGEEPDLHAEPV